MADDLDIRSSGSAAVDTESLRGAAAAARGVSARLRGLDAPLHLAGRFVAGVPGLRSARDVQADLMRECRRLERLAEDCERLTASLENAADLYELVEIFATRDLAGGAESSATRDLAGGAESYATRDRAGAAESSAGSGSERDQLDARAAAIGARLWGVSSADEAREMLIRTGALPSTPGGGTLDAQILLGSALLAGAAGLTAGLVTIAAVRLAAAAGGAARSASGSVGSSAPRSRPPDAAGVAALRRGPSVAVSGFAAASSRISSGEGQRIRVERYTMPGGAREWAVYITGTQSLGFGGPEAFDMASNLGLFRGDESAASTAVREALADAGVRRGEPVHAFAHSQGAMAAESLARDDRLDIRTLVTFGAPTTGPLPADVTAVTIRHLDDPVVALAGPLPAAERGSADGFVVERVADPLPGPRDITLPAHQLVSYTEPAGMLDAFADPRVRALDTLWQHLGAAESVEATDYGARRISRADAWDAG